MTNWFITGTSSGIGRDLVEELLLRGDRVAATLRTPGPLDELKKRYGEQLFIALLDVCDVDVVRYVVDDAFGAFGRIDVIVNNAGYGLFGTAEELSDAQIRRQIDTNLIGSISVIRAALPHLRQQGGGRIVQVSSEGGQITYPNFSLYHATKWGIEGFIGALAQEVAPFDILCTIVEPGPTHTGFGAALDRATEMREYDPTPAGEMRRQLAAATSSWEYGASIDVAQAIIAVADSTSPPRRLILGRGPLSRIRAELLSRLAEVDAQSVETFDSSHMTKSP